MTWEETDFYFVKCINLIFCNHKITECSYGNATRTYMYNIHACTALTRQQTEQQLGTVTRMSMSTFY